MDNEEPEEPDDPRGRRPRPLAWAAGLAALALAATGAGGWMMWMPGSSVREPLADATAPQQALAARLEAHVRALADEVGERNLATGDSLASAAQYVEARLRDAGYDPERQTYELSGQSSATYTGARASNLIAELRGTERPDEIVVVGAHYDTVSGSPGADDDASGIAAMLQLARRLRNRPQPRTLRFVAFANEEPPFFLTEDMGSFAYAARCRRRGDDIVSMLALDGIGYFSSEPESQHFPIPGPALLYPDRGNFIAFISRVRDASLLRRAIGAFRQHATIPSEGAALPSMLPGVGWSDHWSFWQHDYPAFLVTDTLPFRYPYYHSAEDTSAKLDYERLARVTEGLESVLLRLAE